MTVDNVLDFTPELRREGLALLEGYEYGPLYTPIGERPTILMPGRVGGANWKGAAFNPETAILYVPSQRLPLAFDAGSGAAMTGARDAEQAAADGSAGLVTGPDGLPLFKPPYDRLTAIDLSGGELLWPRRSVTGHEVIRGSRTSVSAASVAAAAPTRW